MKTQMTKLIDAEIVRETDKAYQIEVTFVARDGETRGWKLWFPRSTVEVREDGIWAANWIINKKNEELPGHGFRQIEIEREPATVAAGAKMLTIAR